MSLGPSGNPSFNLINGPSLPAFSSLFPGSQGRAGAQPPATTPSTGGLNSPKQDIGPLDSFTSP
jgi:hypothetical protein